MGLGLGLLEKKGGKQFSVLIRSKSPHLELGQGGQVTFLKWLLFGMPSQIQPAQQQYTDHECHRFPGVGRALHGKNTVWQLQTVRVNSKKHKPFPQLVDEPILLAPFCGACPFSYKQTSELVKVVIHRRSLRIPGRRAPFYEILRDRSDGRVITVSTDFIALSLSSQ